MKTYLSFGAGVNSVAMYLLLVNEGAIPGDPVNGFEAVYVDHGGDWPETGEYVQGFAEKFPLTILKPSVEGHTDLYSYAAHFRMIPSRTKRWCTDKFKVRVITGYVQTPNFQLIGISAEESHRAKLSSTRETEHRFPLIERGIDRDECVKIIQRHGLPLPIKSGCYFCPFQRVGQWKQLRRKHPELYCRAKQLEDAAIQFRLDRGHPIQA